MKPNPLLRSLFAPVLFLAVFVPLASAHPGHDLTDIPAVLRHPFAGVDHMLVSATVLAITGATMLVATRLMRTAPAVRWVGAGMLAAAVALAFI